MVDVDFSLMPSRIVCDGRPRVLGGCVRRELDAWEGRLSWVWRQVGVACGVEVDDGPGEACEEGGGAAWGAEGACGEQGEEMDEDGEPDGELDGVLGVAEEVGQGE